MKKSILISYLIVLLISIQIFSQVQGKIHKVNNYDSRSFININNIYTDIHNTGLTDYGNFFFPTASGNYMGYATGFLFGVKLPNEEYPRVGGNYYVSGLQPGNINPDGTASDRNLNKFRVYRVRPDIFPGGPKVDLSYEAKSSGESEDIIRAEYENDWNSWPAQLGAPYNDINNDKIYEPGIDIPGVPGADQTLWYVANDLDSTLTKNLYGADPIGIEIQATIWAYNVNGTLGNTIFRKFRFINKSISQSNPAGITYDSMYVAMFSDADVVDYSDDVMGSDSTLGLSYIYNSKEPPENYWNGYPESSLGFQLLSGPVVDSPGDTAHLNGRIILNKKNLPATASMYLDRYNRDLNFSDPVLHGIAGSQQFYNMFRGRYPRSGNLYYDSLDQRSTRFIFDGDPVKGTGWFQKPNTLHDSRLGIASGSFTMAPGDTQEVVFAEYAIIAKDRISSVKTLRFGASVIKEFFNQRINIKDIPPVPMVKPTSDGSGITLDWGSSQSSVDSIENFDKNGFKFQGYNIYMMEYPLINFKDYILKIGHFDKIDNIKDIQGQVEDPVTGFPVKGIIQDGSDSGIKRKLVIPYDSLGNNHFVIGKTYYFGVTAYTYNPDQSLLNQSTESLVKIIPVIFRNDYSGKKYSDTLIVNHISGTGEDERIVIPIVTDPQLLSGDQYKVKFDTLSNGNLIWSLYDITSNKYVLNSQPVNDTVNVLSGLDLIVRGSKKFSGNNDVSIVRVNADPSNGFPYGYSVAGNNNNIDLLDAEQNLQLKFTGVPARGAENSNDTLIVSGGSIATIYNNDKTISKRIRIPFELWEVERNRQINVIIYSISDSLLGYNPPWGSGGTPLWYRIYPDVIASVATSYNPFAGTDIINENNPKLIKKIKLQGLWDTGDIIELIYQNPLTPADAYIFNSNPENQLNKISALPEDYILFQNYPNPFNPVTTIKYSIPRSGFVKLKIYNILGQEIESLVSEQQDKGFHQIVSNFTNLASGIYIYSLSVDGEYKMAKKMILLK